jgi:hypothetical protein
VIRAAAIALTATALGFGAAYVIVAFTDAPLTQLLTMVAGGVIYKAAFAVYKRGHGGLVATRYGSRLPPGS